MICTESTCRRLHSGSNTPLPKRVTMMLRTVSLPRKWSMRKICGSARQAVIRRFSSRAELALLRAGEALDEVAQLAADLAVAERGVVDPQDREIAGQQAVALQVVEGRDEQALGEIAGDPEDHHQAGGGRGRAVSGRH